MQMGLWEKAEGKAGPTEVSVVNFMATLGAQKAEEAASSSFSEVRRV